MRGSHRWVGFNNQRLLSGRRVCEEGRVLRDETLRPWGQDLQGLIYKMFGDASLIYSAQWVIEGPSLSQQLTHSHTPAKVAPWTFYNGFLVYRSTKVAFQDAYSGPQHSAQFCHIMGEARYVFVLDSAAGRAVEWATCQQT